MPKGSHAFLDHWRLVRPDAEDFCTVLVDDEKWYVVDNGILGYLSGIVRGHPRLTEGHLIITSEVLAIALDKSWAVTRNTHYLLGSPDEGPADLLKDTKVQRSLGVRRQII